MDWMGLAIDGGGSKTQLALMDQTGHTRKAAVVPGGNLKALGVSHVLQNLQVEIQSFLQSANCNPNHIEAVSCGFAGAGREPEQQEIEQILQSWFPRASLFVTHDAHLALASGTFAHDGAVLIAGTGSIVFATDGGKSVRVGGWGNRLGDEGSGYWLGMQVLQAVMQAHDGRIPPSRLKETVFAHFGIDHADKILELVYDCRIPVHEIAKLSRYAFIDDPAAKSIREKGSGELAHMVRSAKQRLGHLEQVVLQGGMFQEPLYVELLQQRLPDIHFLQPTVPPIGGAIALLFEKLTPDVISNIQSEWSDSHES